MHQKTKQEIVVKARVPEPVCWGDLCTGTLVIDPDCNLYLVTSNGIFFLEDGTPYPAIGGILPRDFRVVPKVTFHVELEGEG